jgi:hypothetical protein
VTTRWALIGVTVVWAVLAVSGWGISEEVRRYPDVVADLALAAAVAHAGVNIWPRSRGLWMTAGLLGVLTLCSRTLSLLWSAYVRQDPDIVWLSLGAAAITALTAATYWNWWLTSVVRWRHAEARS